MNATWRLLLDDDADGATNMARDEALAVAHAGGATPPTLRLYRWRPACLSLGRFQRSAAVDQAACARAGVAVVRRPSGGRALLHDDELTYAVIARADHPLIARGSVVESYRRISEALLAGLLRLGVEAELTPATKNKRRTTGDERRTTNDERRSGVVDELPPREKQSSPTNMRNGLPDSALSSTFVAHPSSAACFDAPASYELTVSGRKLVGSAQTRHDGVLLQHGAIPLTPHAERLAALLADPPDDLGHKMIALDQALGHAVDFDELARALVDGFTQAWGVELRRGELTDAERALERQLRAEKYAAERWTYMR